MTNIRGIEKRTSGRGDTVAERKHSSARRGDLLREFAWRLTWAICFAVPENVEGYVCTGEWISSVDGFRLTNL